MIILGKKVVGRKETLEYANQKFKWLEHGIIGISCFYGFWAWVLARLTRRKCIYYCIDFYSPEVFTGWWDKIFIPLAILMDRFLCKVCDEVWDISERINAGRIEFGHYHAKSKIVPLSYPPDYFRFEKTYIGQQQRIVFVGLKPYGLELLKPYGYIWIGKDERLTQEAICNYISRCGIGFSMWKERGNNYYGDPGKTKLYSACGLPVIMTDNTPYAEIIKKTGAGIIVEYHEESVRMAIKYILANYDYYKNNVKKTWKYINADELFKYIQILEQ